MSGENIVLGLLENLAKPGSSGVSWTSECSKGYLSHKEARIQ